MATKKQSKKELFLELAQPDKDGCSRWVNVTEFVGKYSVLVMGNGCDWGRKNDMRVSDMSTQQIDDFQPLCKAANDIKRQICKNCTQSDKRWDARNIEGNPYGFYEGDERYNGTCVGCYQYDPVEYRKRSALRIIEESSKHTAQFIMEKLYPSITHKK